LITQSTYHYPVGVEVVGIVATVIMEFVRQYVNPVQEHLNKSIVSLLLERLEFAHAQKIAIALFAALTFAAHLGDRDEG